MSAPRLLIPIVLVVGGCADTLILHPTTQPLETPAARRVIPWAGGDLEAWTLRTPDVGERGPDVFVLAFIGNGDRAEQRVVVEADLWRGRSAEIWALNYPGYGGSGGPPRLQSIPGAALASFDELRRIATGRPLLVSGNSLGTAAALHVAACRPVDGLLLRNPPPLRSLILGSYGWWNLWVGACIVAGQIPAELDSLANAAKARAPALFILSTRDGVVPPAYQQAVVDAYAGPRTLVPLDGGHNKALTEEARKLVQEALRKIVPPKEE